MAAASMMASGIDLLPGELLDLITEKVRQDCKDSFKALEGTSKSFCKSARRCTQSLQVIRPSMRIEEQGNDATASSPMSKQIWKILAEEIKKRPSLFKLTLHESVLSEAAGSKSPILKALSGVSWVTCTIFGHRMDSAQSSTRQLVSWDGSSGRRALSAFKASLKELTLIDFDFLQSRLSKLAQTFSNLASLSLGGYGCANNLQHDNLEELDGLGLCDPTRPQKRVRFEGAWLPNLRHLTARACCKTAPGSGKILLLGSFADRCRLPHNLEILNLQWRMSIEFKELVHGKLVQKLLSNSECTQLQKIHVQVTDAAAQDSCVSVACTGKLFRAEARHLFRTCPSLEELCFTASNGGRIVKWKRSSERVREFDWGFGQLCTRIILKE